MLFFLFETVHPSKLTESIYQTRILNLVTPVKNFELSNPCHNKAQFLSF